MVGFVFYCEGLDCFRQAAKIRNRLKENKNQNENGKDF